MRCWAGGGEKKSGVQSPSPNALRPLATLAPHKSLGLVRRGNLLSWVGNTQGQQIKYTLLPYNIVTSIYENL